VDETHEDSDDNSFSFSGTSPLLKESKLSSNSQRRRLLTNLQSFCKQSLGKSVNFLRKQEVNIANLHKTLTCKNGNESSEFDFIMNDTSKETWNDMEGREDMVMVSIEDQTSSEQMKEILKKINQLTKMLSNVNEVVIAQGEVIDRIDYNMEVALDNVAKGNKQLHEAKERMEKGCAAKAIKMLFVINIVLFLLVVLKLRD
jgi:syntaxin 16